MSLVWVDNNCDDVKKKFSDKILVSWSQNYVKSLIELKRYLKGCCMIILSDLEKPEEILDMLFQEYETAKIFVAVYSDKAKKDPNLRASLLRMGACCICFTDLHIITCINKFYNRLELFRTEPEESKILRKSFWLLAKVKFAKTKKDTEEIVVTDPSIWNRLAKQVSVISPTGFSMCVPKKIVEIVNEDLMGAFYLRKCKMYFPNKPDEFLFHGTNHDLIQSIVKEGFRLPEGGINGKFHNKFGDGVYLAIEPTKSDQYVKNHNNNKKLLICQTSLGFPQPIFRGTSQTQPCDVIPRRDSYFIPGDLKKKLSDNLHDEYVIFHPFQSVPRYVVEYEICDLNKMCGPCKNLVQKQYEVFVDPNQLNTVMQVEFNNKHNSPVIREKKIHDKVKKKDWQYYAKKEEKKKDIAYWKKMAAKKK
jgi:hypothetical protein